MDNTRMRLPLWLTPARMALNAEAAAHDENYTLAAYWTEMIDRAQAETVNEWDALKGSPEHG